MTKHNIEVSKEVRDEYVRLKWEIKNLWWQEIDDGQVMWAMIWGFFDSLEYMKTHQHEHNHERWHQHDHDWCCGWHWEEDHECCGWKWDDCCCK